MYAYLPDWDERDKRLQTGDTPSGKLLYSGSRLDAVQFDLSPNLSPCRREALILTPLPLQGRGWGLGFSALLHATEKCYKYLG